MKHITPFAETKLNKKDQVALMFNKIAGTYDFLNHFLSGGIDIFWRRRAIKSCKGTKVSTVLDVATGTGDFAIDALRLNPQKVIGVDIADDMLALGRKKIHNKGLSSTVKLMAGDCEKLEFDDDAFDLVISAFGVRNFENLSKCLKEMYRVCKRGGSVMIVEFSKPRKFPMKQFYPFYLIHVMPLLGKILSRERNAYVYLAKSVMAFPDDESFLRILGEAGFKNCQQKKLTFGVCSVYSGAKQ